ncbi:MAG: aldehyde dehydrogenase [Myxococcota bacterium]
MTLEPLQNYINGRFQPAHDGSTLDDLAPATGERLTTLPNSGPDDVNQAVAAAKAAMQGPWSKTSAAERADLCEAIADRIEADLDAFATLESADTGKPLALAKSLDIPRAVSNFRFFAAAIRSHSEPSFTMADAVNHTLRGPVGVVGLITPWNLPLYLLTWKAAPALVTGNAIVAKPSEVTPLTAGRLAEVIDDLGAPPGAFNLVQGLGPSVGAPLCAHADVDAVSFTGGTATGVHVASAVAPRFAKLSLELGGKNASVVFEDADLEHTVPTVVRAAFTNTGQICLCGSRLFVHRSQYADVVEAVVAQTKALVIGDPQDPSTNLGPLVSQAHRAKVERYIALAKEEGGTLRTGGPRPELPPPFSNGNFLSPTVIEGLAPDSRTATEEIFGPVLTVHPFDDETEVIERVNAVRYGLSASIFTRDLTRAHRVGRALDVGTVWVNTWLKRDLRVPFGGHKDSGVGREGGDYSLRFFTEPTTLCIQLDPA